MNVPIMEDNERAKVTPPCACVGRELATDHTGCTHFGVPSKTARGPKAPQTTLDRKFARCIVSDPVGRRRQNDCGNAARADAVILGKRGTACIHGGVPVAAIGSVYLRVRRVCVDMRQYPSTFCIFPGRAYTARGLHLALSAALPEPFSQYFEAPLAVRDDLDIITVAV
jgi:hypothetical protein